MAVEVAPDVITQRDTQRTPTTVIRPVVYPGLIELDAKVAGSTTVVSVVGELDMATVDTFRDFVGAVLEPESTVVLDLTAMPFMDSMGLGAIVGLANRAKAAEGNVVLRNPNRNVTRLLEATAVDTYVPVERTIDLR
jgi:anti-sigma B factor antagonist